MNRAESEDWSLRRSYSVVSEEKKIVRKSEKLEKLKKDMLKFVQKIDDTNVDVKNLTEDQRLELYQILGKKNIPKRKKKKVVKK